MAVRTCETPPVPCAILGVHLFSSIDWEAAATASSLALAGLLACERHLLCAVEENNLLNFEIFFTNPLFEVNDHGTILKLA